MNRLNSKWVIGGIAVAFMAVVAFGLLALLLLFLAGTGDNSQVATATATARAIARQATAEIIATQAAAEDSDNDGLLDAQERTLGTNPRNPDSDGDGLTDGQEVNETGTNPLDRDSDDDGILDGADNQAPGAPTPFPTFAPLRPTPIQISPGGSNVVAASGSPAQAVIDYYNLVSGERYDLSWPLLTDQFKQIFNCCAPNYNYSGYVQWWDSVDYVSFGAVNTVSQQGDRAVIYVELNYHMQAGGVSRDRQAYIEMVNDNGIWRFANKGPNATFR